MKKGALVITLALVFAFAVSLPFLLFDFKPAFAHTAVVEGDIRLVAGWGSEPPLVGQLNTIDIRVVRVSEDRPVTNAFANAQVMVTKGGLEKELIMSPGETAGWYHADIIPTQLGEYGITITGTIDRQDVNAHIDIEHVEDTRRLNFPESGGAGPGQGVPEDFIEQMRTVLTTLTLEIEDANDLSRDARDAARSAAESASETRTAADVAYMIGIVGIGAGVAGIAIAVVALSRKG